MNELRNEARDALHKVMKLLENPKISSYHIAKEAGLSSSQVIRLRHIIRDHQSLSKVRISTFIKIIDYINAVEADRFRTK